jgi:endonuclease/exonuclease/phosphatase (EEP) superfamily protein YafD
MDLNRMPLRVGAGFGLLLPCALGAGLSVASTHFHLEGALGWVADLAVHWQWMYLCVGLVAALLAVLQYPACWALSVAGAAVCVTSFVQYAPALQRADAGHGATLKVASANVFFGNSDMGRLIEWIAREAPDIVVLQEVTPSAAMQLRQLTAYPHMLISDAPEPFALALLSRLPFSTVEAVEWTLELPGQKLSYRATISWHGRDIAVAAVHLAAPTEPGYRLQRDSLLEDTARWAALSNVPVVVAGDLNATPWSRGLKRAAEIGLRRATSLMPTWPAVTQYSMVIPIDHVLASIDWVVVARKRGPDFGSDHRPVVVTLELSATAGARR